MIIIQMIMTSSKTHNRDVILGAHPERQGQAPQKTGAPFPVLVRAPLALCPLGFIFEDRS